MAKGKKSKKEVSDEEISSDEVEVEDDENMVHDLKKRVITFNGCIHDLLTS